MEETINIRSYLIALSHYWKWFLRSVLFTVSVILLIDFLIPPIYQATALIFVTEPREVIQFDPRIQSAEENQHARAYPELATSDQILEELLVQAGPMLSEIATVTQLRNIIRAESGSDTSLIRLIVSAENPEIASQITNMWAELFVSQINDLYGDGGGAQVRFFEEQLNEAEVDLRFSEDALVNFQSNNRISVITDTLAFQRQSYSDYLLTRESIILLIQDTQALQEQLDKQTNNQELSFSNQLTALSLQLQTFNVEFVAAPLLFQIDEGNSLTVENLDDQVFELEQLIGTLGNKLIQTEILITDLEPQIMELQQELQQLELEKNQLTLNFQLAQDTYTILARKVEEEKIASGDTISGAKLVSQASIPEVPVSTQLPILLFAGVLSSIVCTSFVIFFIQWWHNASIPQSD
ncbi:GumC family protein [Candidatus Leptofilum sp.]|uniref:GumC family protein n=1 Tax=Candidatus Leptofilum sp. TaxID=3241576 RepID=UPI003B5A1FAC